MTAGIPLTFLTAASLGAGGDPPRVSIPDSEVQVFRSAAVGRELEVWVAHPVATAFPSEPRPPHVVYVLDADLIFGAVVDMTRLMHQLFAELPPLLIVGVAYPTEDRNVQSQLRNRDFTPVPDPEWEAQAATFLAGTEQVLPEGQRLGGASKFLRFLADELQPFIREHYEVAAHGDTLIGTSLGGLFATYALLTEPDLFDHYVIASPALWWSNEQLFELEEQFSQQHKDLPARVFLAAGSLEENPAIPMLARFKMVSNTVRMATLLAGHDYPSLDLEYRILDGETHTTVVPVAVTRGLRHVFGPREPSKKTGGEE